MMHAKYLTFAALFLYSAVLVTAQDDGTDSVIPVDGATSTDTGMQSSGSSMLTDCMRDCLSTALSSGKCTSYTDLACVCVDIAFQTAAAQCLKKQCLPEDVDNAEALQKSQCDSTVSPASTLVSNSVPGTQSVGGTSTVRTLAGSSSSHTSTASGSASSSTGTNAAVGSDRDTVGKAWVFGIGVVILCLTGGGLSVF